MLKCIERLIKVSNKKNMSLSEMKTLAKATSNYRALNYLNKVGGKELAAIKRQASLYESNKPKASTNGKTTMFGLSGKDAGISEKDNKKMYDRKPIKKVDEEDKDIRKRRKVEKFRKETSDRKKDFSAVSKPTSAKSRFSEVLNRSKKAGKLSRRLRSRKKMAMESYEIYWSDLTEEAQERLQGMYHENIDISPIAFVDIEDDVEASRKLSRRLRSRKLRNKRRFLSGKKPGVQDGTGPYHMKGDNPRAGAEKGDCDKKATIKISEVQPGQQVGVTDPTTGESKNITIDETAMDTSGQTSYIGTDETGNKVVVPQGTEVMVPEEIVASTVLSKIRNLVGISDYSKS